MRFHALRRKWVRRSVPNRLFRGTQGLREARGTQGLREAMIALQIVFWSAVLLILQAYIGYPLGIYIKSRRQSEPGLDREIGEVPCPLITVLIPAYNEERWITRKIENTLELEYPRERLQVLVATDGCTDQTVAIARKYAGRGVDVWQNPNRSGKSALLNCVVSQAAGEIVLVTDVSALLARNSIRLIQRHFQDPSVGCVTGPRVCLQTESPASEGEGLYWRYEAWVKRSESRLGTCLGANGQVMAVRKSLFPKIPEINDDFYVSMKVLVVDRAKVLFEEGAKAFIPAAANLRRELERKIRTNEGFLRDIPYFLPALNPLSSPIWWRFFSHHVLRRIVPFAMLAACIASGILSQESGFFRVALYAQVLFYGGAVIGFVLERRNLRSRLFYLPFYFSFANIAVLLAWARWARRKNGVAWERTERIVPEFTIASPERRTHEPN